ncbi:MAG: aminoacyl-tRNA deacylase [Bdellovibrionaceae bacterium]|nr:aminoacyl-tRNA deacylase [Pseudobdellovibrionaceae bacterium]
MTNATRELARFGIAYQAHVFRYEEKGGTRVSSRELGVEEHAVIKTLLFEDESKAPMIVLMHGDCQVSTKQLARELGVKQIAPCRPETAERHSGYQVGGTSPFGTRKHMPVYMERTILDLPRIYINGGKRGFLVSFPPAELMRVLEPRLVSVAIQGEHRKGPV